MKKVKVFFIPAERNIYKVGQPYKDGVVLETTFIPEDLTSSVMSSNNEYWDYPGNLIRVKVEYSVPAAEVAQSRFDNLFRISFSGTDEGWFDEGEVPTVKDMKALTEFNSLSSDQQAWVDEHNLLLRKKIYGLFSGYSTEQKILPIDNEYAKNFLEAIAEMEKPTD